MLESKAYSYTPTLWPQGYKEGVAMSSPFLKILRKQSACSQTSSPLFRLSLFLVLEVGHSRKAKPARMMMGSPSRTTEKPLQSSRAVVRFKDQTTVLEEHRKMPL